MFNIALALVLSGDDDGQTVFLAKPVGGTADIVITPLVGMIMLVIRKADRIENQVIMNMIFVYMSGKYKLILAAQDFFCKLHADLMGLFRRDLSRLKGLDQVTAKVRSLVDGMAAGPSKFDIRSFGGTAIMCSYKYICYSTALTEGGLMKQSNNKKSRDVTAFLYERLSRDDNLEGESYSIGNQKKLLAKVAKEKGYTNLVHFLDDGISGVTMDRPGFVEMIRQLEQGKAAAVFVKDLSRLGRNYIEVGRLTEEFFPDHDIRLVAVSDNIDTAEGENELAPIRNLFNEWYARDISKKRRISNKIKGNAGEPMGQPPYGYIKDPNDPKHWIVDDEAAQVVRRVYSMTLEGFGTEQIAAQLEKDDVLTPRAYWLTKGIKRPGKGKQQPPTKWNSSTITKILSLQEYCGDILNFKTYSKSYKNKKRIDNDRENWVVFQDVHEAIIERAVYEQVQQKRGKIRKRRTNNGEHNMFSGLLVCADCGSNLHFHFNQGNPEIKYFNCSNYKGNRGTCTSTHYVRVDFLEEVVLGEMRRLTKFANLYEDEFVKAVIGHSQQAEQTDRKLKEKELRTLLARDEELDGLFERIYEDNVSGKLSDDRFAKMSRRYEDEQKELSEKIKKLRSEIEKQSSRSMTTDMFIGLVRKYTRARKLTPRMLNELIEKIEVFNAEKIDGVWEQRLRIHYNCVGTIEIPTVLPLPIPEVSVNTRKGVVVNYAPCELAV